MSREKQARNGGFRLLWMEDEKEMTQYFDNIAQAEQAAPDIAKRHQCCSLEYWDILAQDWRCEEVYSLELGEGR